ncbi:hypothetical protein [Stenotrophomonas pictorum]|uniref:hypothetical protein n=1 Tax=Stenotrophomonas pictorum TaxID=86184 RepID=UPI0012FD9A45|nr:hypothetical protein [Stenotrophomonas pictorum]
MQRIISQPYPPHSEKRSASAALLLFFGLFLALAGGWLNTRPYSLAIEISLNAPGGPYLQIFPFAGGYSEANVRQVPLQAGRQVVHRLSVQSPRLPKVVRIDPGSAVGMIELQYLASPAFPTARAWKACDCARRWCCATICTGTRTVTSSPAATIRGSKSRFRPMYWPDRVQPGAPVPPWASSDWCWRPVSWRCAADG